MTNELKKELAKIFLEIEIEEYQHTSSYPYKIFGQLLNRKKIKELLEEDPTITNEWIKLLTFFKKNGLSLHKKKQSDSMENTIYAFLHYAFSKPKEAMKPYNTIKLKDTRNTKAYNNEKVKVIEPKKRSAYTDTEKAKKTQKKENKKKMAKVTSLSEKIENNIETKTELDMDIYTSNNTYIGTCGNSNCINGYIETSEGFTYCECYLKERLFTRFKNAGLKKEYFNYNTIDQEKVHITLRSFGEDKSNSKPKDINKFLINYNKNIEKIFNEGWNLTISGPLGSGKTTIASICGKIALINNKSVLYAEVQNLRKIWTGEKLNEHLETLKEKLVEVDLLILDDLGQEFISSRSEFQMSEMDLLFRERIAKNKPYIITTNAEEKDIKERYSKRIFSLLHKKNLFFTVYSDEDLRKSKSIEDANFLLDNC